MKKERLLAAARNNPRNVRYSDLISLVKAFGFVFSRQKGSHEFYHRRGGILCLQNRRGMAKPYQVVQFLRLIEGERP